MDRNWIPTVAGVLDIVVAGLALLGVAGLSVAAFIVTYAPRNEGDEFGLFVAQSILICLLIAFLIALVLSVVGGIAALQRKRWGWALTGAIAAAFVCPPLGVPAIVFTVIAEKEMRSGQSSIG